MLKKIIGVFLLLLFFSMASAELKPIPAECAPDKLPGHMNDVLPCYLSNKEKDYDWRLKSTTVDTFLINGKSHKIRIHLIELTSLRWLVGEKDKVSHPVWKHRLTIYQPEKVVSDTALLYINGGTLYSKERSAAPEITDDLEFSRIAARTQSLVIDLKDIPNQFLTFGSGEPLSEDHLIAYTWNKFLMDPVNNYNWPLRLPMVKSVMSAMDASQAFLSNQKTTLRSFVVSGGSKRGWTAWLTAMDKRVVALVPMVADFLNMPEMMRHLFSVYPQGNPAISAYMSLRPLIGSDPMNKLIAIVDPYQYRQQLTQPKYIVSASGDNFMPSDTNQFYFPGLAGEKWMRVLPNRSHYIIREDRKQISDIVESFYGAFIEGRPMPELKWEEEGGRLYLESSISPKSARLWTAYNPVARDFRKTPDNNKVSEFSSSVLSFNCRRNCKLELDLPAPEKGWSASFVEVGFNNAPYADLIFTTRVFITPDRYPEQEKQVDKKK